MPKEEILENPFEAWNEVEVFLRLKGHLPNQEGDGLKAQDYKAYCDMVMFSKRCPRGRIYKHDSVWIFAWRKYRELKKIEEG